MPPRTRLLLQSASLALLGALTSFLLLTGLHTQLGRLTHFDLSLQARVHAFTQPMLTRIMIGLSIIGAVKVFIPTLLLALIVMLLIGEKEGGVRMVRKRHTSALFAFAIGGAILLNESFKTWFHRPRPNVPWSIGDEHTFSFPSGHSIFSTVLYGLIAYLVLARRTPLPRRLLTAILAITMPLAIGLSRIYLGVHFPTDVLAGYITGLCWLTTTILIDHRWRAQNKKTERG